MTWQEQALKHYELIWIQRFHGTGQCLSPVCDKCRSNRAIGLWRDKDYKAYALCAKCSTSAEPPIPYPTVTTYRPTEYPKFDEPIQK